MIEANERLYQLYQRELKIRRRYDEILWRYAFGDYSKSTKTKLLQEALQQMKDELRLNRR